MKKIFVVLITLFMLTACSSSGLSKLSYKKLNDKLDKKETFVLLLTDNTDSNDTLKNTLKKVSKENNLKCFYLNTDKLSSDDKEKLQSKITFEDSNIIVFIKNGVENSILTRIDDTYISSDSLKKELQEQGYLK